MATRKTTETASQTQPPPTHQVNFDEHGLVLLFDELMDAGTLARQALALSVASRAIKRCAEIADETNDGSVIHGDMMADAEIGIAFLTNMSIAMQEHVVNAQKARRSA